MHVDEQTNADEQNRWWIFGSQ